MPITALPYRIFLTRPGRNIFGGALKSGDRVSLVGFGSFSVSHRAARTGRNPQTGAEIKIKAKNVVKFKAGAGLTV